MYLIEFENDVIDKNFVDVYKFVEWFEKHMDDTVYFDEEMIDKKHIDIHLNATGWNLL